MYHLSLFMQSPNVLAKRCKLTFTADKEYKSDIYITSYIAKAPLSIAIEPKAIPPNEGERKRIKTLSELKQSSTKTYKGSTLTN